jgi:hypothetical protein
MSRHRLYFDESGTHCSRKLETVHEQYLALCGVIFEHTDYVDFQTQWESMKRAFFGGDPDEPVILHRKELMGNCGLFSVLEDQATRRKFDAEFLRIVGEARFTSLIAVIDKARHQKNYPAPMNPYHYCFVALMQRYCFWLGSRKGDVMGEARGKTEDHQLKAAFRTLHEHGDWYCRASTYQNHLTSRDIKLKPKSENIAGLQLADLLAHPAKLRCILNHGTCPHIQESRFGKQVADLFWTKIRKRPDGASTGWGEVFI